MHSIKDQYQKRLMHIDEALSMIQSDQVIVAAMAASEPRALMENLARRAQELNNVSFHCANPESEHSCFIDPNLFERICFNVMFVTSPVRGHLAQGNVHYVPQHLSQWTRNLISRGTIDVFWGSCSEPDGRGFVSLGVGACYEPEMVFHAKKVILEVNPQMPQTFGATHVPITMVDAFVENNHPLQSLQDPEITDVDLKIGQLVADLIEDESTIQLGIGAIPNAIAGALRGKKNLGVHTELINDAVRELYECGVVTGRCKTLWPGKIVGAFVYGSKKLYDFVDRNPMVELHPASVVNDHYRIGRNHKMVSVNTAIEMDLSGQVVSESVGHRQISGVGGAVDTHVGAQKSLGGRGIIAMHSTVKNNAGSKIVHELRPGAKISISRNDIDTVVTEYGVAYLRGRSEAERAKAMIGISHPDFRQELKQKAHEIGLL